MPRALREIPPGTELFVSIVPGFRPRLERTGSTSQYRTPVKGRMNRTSPQIGDFYGSVISNTDFVLTLRPIRPVNIREQPPKELVVIPYYALSRVLEFSGSTNEDTVKTGRNIVGGSTFSQWRGIAWDNRKNTPIPLEQPHMKPAERLFREVRIA